MGLLNFFLGGLLALLISQAHGLPPLTTRADPNPEIIVHNGVSSGKTLYVYVNGIVGGSWSVLKTDGTWGTVTAGTGGDPTPIDLDDEFTVAAGAELTLTLPSYVVSGRVYIFEGAGFDWKKVQDAAGRTGLVQPALGLPGVPSTHRWSFAEFTSNEGGAYVNPSNVDFISLPVGITTTETTGRKHYVAGLLQEVPGSRVRKCHGKTLDIQEAGGGQAHRYTVSAGALPVTAANVTELICAELRAQAKKDGQRWGELCVYGDPKQKNPTRILAPGKGKAQGKAFVLDDYYSGYIGDVWTHYTHTPLYIDTQRADLGVATCQVDAATDALACDKTAVRMARPTADDVWGCDSGPFHLDGGSDAGHKAIVPRLCAALTRSTLLLPGGERQPGGPPVAAYYAAPITNHFARVVHQFEVGGGYAFPYDDVTVPGAAQDGLVHAPSLARLDVYVGG